MILGQKMTENHPSSTSERERKLKKVKEAKATILVHQYELFRMKEDEDIETMYSRFQTLVFRRSILIFRDTISSCNLGQASNVPMSLDLGDSLHQRADHEVKRNANNT